MSAYLDLRNGADSAWRAIAAPERPLIKVVDTTCSRASGSADTLQAVRDWAAKAGSQVDVMITGCWGLCYAEPMVEVSMPGGRSVLYGEVRAADVPELLDAAVTSNATPIEKALAVVSGDAQGVPAIDSLPFMAGQTRRLMANCGVTDPNEIDHYIARGGYEGLSKALQVGPDATINEVMASGVWGRGGAAFPAGRKWDFLRGAERAPKYIICNADEGDPGAFVNRNLMESDPHLVVEGVMIAGIATNADQAFIYIRDEYPLPVGRMERAVEQARERGLCGKGILGSEHDFEVTVVRGAGSYVCGDETGLLSSLEDRRGMPKIKPPYPAQAGAFAKPSNINNVETYANAPLIMREGAAWWSEYGTEANRGTKMFSLSGQVQRVGIVEVPLGTRMGAVINDMGGGVPEGHTLKAIQSGGPLSGIIAAIDIDIPLEPEPFRERGSLMGGGGLVIMDDTSCIVDMCVYFQWFAEDESCGRCTTCFAGTRRMLEILRRITYGRGRAADLELMKLLRDVAQNANCFHGQGAPTSIMTMFRHFEDELMEHVEQKRCRAKACKGLLRYEVAHQSDLLPLAEAICPTGAVVKDNGAYRIDQERCVRCDACREQVPYAIALVDEFAS